MLFNSSRFYYGYIIVLAAFLIQLLGFGLFQSFGIFFKPILYEFGWNRAVTSGAYSLAWFIQGWLNVLMGRLTDQIGPRRVVSFCGLIIGTGFIMMSRIGSVLELYLYFGIIGIGLSSFNVSLVSTAARWFSKSRGAMSGFVMAGGGMGTLVIPLFAQPLIFTYGWRLSYVVLGCIVTLLVVLLAQLLRRDPEEMNQLPLGKNLNEGQHLSPEGASLTFKEAICTKEFWKLFFMMFCLGYCASGIVVHIAPHSTDIGIPASMAAKVLSTVGGMAIVGRVVMGSVGDKVGTRRGFMIGFFCIMISLAWLIVGTKPWMLFSAAILFGCFWGIGSLASPLVAELFGLLYHGVNLGLINLGYCIGATVGPYLLGHIFDLTGNYRLSFLSGLSTAFFGMVLAVSLKSKRGTLQPSEVLS